MSIEYRLGNDLDLEAVINLYRSSTLGARRPVDNKASMARMLKEANLVVTAWKNSQLIGIARSLSDFTFCTYLSDIAVDLDHQRQGIGKELIRQTQRAGGTATIFLFAAPAALHYYGHIGFASGNGFILRSNQQLK
jgi:ribosomal protein S18 acetylase RimI-like enzyme